MAVSERLLTARLNDNKATDNPSVHCCLCKGLEPPIDEIDRKKLVWMREKEIGFNETERNWFR